MYDDIQHATATNSLPDLLAVGDTWVQSLAKKDAITSLQPYFDTWRLHREGGDITLDFIRNSQYTYVHNQQVSNACITMLIIFSGSRCRETLTLVCCSTGKICT